MITDQIVFMHIPKTAGTSLNETLSQSFNSDEVVRYYYHNGSYPTLNKMKKGFFTGHFEYGLQDAIFNSPFNISFLRNPIDRLISQINFDQNFFSSQPNGYQRQLEIFNKSVDYKEFIMETRSVYFDNAQVRAFANISNEVDFGEIKLSHFQEAIRNLDKFDYIGFQEEFEPCVRELCTILNIDPKLSKENIASNTPWINKDEIDNIYDTTFLRSLNCWDELLYQYAYSSRNALPCGGHDREICALPRHGTS